MVCGQVPGDEGERNVAGGRALRGPRGEEHRAMQMTCAECGCVVEQGRRVAVCADGNCCCAHLPVAMPHASGGEARPRQDGGRSA